MYLFFNWRSTRFFDWVIGIGILSVAFDNNLLNSYPKSASGSKRSTWAEHKMSHFFADGTGFAIAHHHSSRSSFYMKEHTYTHTQDSNITIEFIKFICGFQWQNTIDIMVKLFVHHPRPLDTVVSLLLLFFLSYKFDNMMHYLDTNISARNCCVHFIFFGE